MKNKIILTFAFLLATIFSSHAEPKSTPILERLVTVSFTEEKIQIILDTISKQADFNFSYSPTALPLTKKISVDFQDETVENVLNSIFEGSVKYVIVENYLVMQVRSDEEKEEITVSEEDKTEQVQPVDTIQPLKEEPEHDEIIETSEADEPITDTKKLSSDTITDKHQPQPAVSDKQPEPKDIMSVDDTGSNDTLTKNFQISFFPGVGIDGPSTKHNTYKFSVNVFLGKVKGINIMEFGGIGNIVEQDAGVVQGAGIFNVVGGNYNGIQGAGIFNNVGGNVRGVQLSRVFNTAQSLYGFQSSGVINIVKEDAGFIQTAGVANITGGHFQGIQGASVFNKANSLNGAQLSGVFNISGKTEGIQIAGVFNKAKESPGFQATGILNHADKINGTQLAGIINLADSVNGAQIAGVFNRAHFFRGVQVAMINVADSCQGIPLGFVNIIRKGYKKLEFYTNEMLEVNMAYRGGIKPFHTILSVGINPEDLDDPFWNIGIGLGSSINYSKNASLEVELMSKMISKGSYIAYQNRLSSIGAGIDWYVSPKLSVYSGITFNMYLADTESDYYEDHFSGFMPYTLSDTDFDDGFNLKTWFGIKLGARIF